MPQLDDTLLAQLEQTATTIRQRIIHMLLAAGSGHSAGSLGMADVFTTLYFSILNHTPSQPHNPDRDYVLVSNGHICPVWYATLAEAGYFPVEELTTLRQFKTRLQGHPYSRATPGVENTSGSLGQGISAGAGIAWALKHQHKKNRVFVVTSDGEHQEGQTWEAYMFAATHRLNNLTVMVDRNNIQIDGFTEDIGPLEPLAAKLTSFGWHVLEIDGHNHQAIRDACQEAQAIHEKPSVIICHTIPGKGVEYMENLPEWHGKPPNVPESIEALRQLRTLCTTIECHDT
jgi:transketolase